MSQSECEYQTVSSNGRSTMQSAMTWPRGSQTGVNRQRPDREVEQVARAEVVGEAQRVGAAQLRLPLRADVPERHALRDRAVLDHRIAPVVDRHVRVVVDHEPERTRGDRPLEVRRPADGVRERLALARRDGRAHTSGAVSKYSVSRAMRPSRTSIAIANGKSKRAPPSASAERNMPSDNPTSPRSTTVLERDLAFRQLGHPVARRSRARPRGRAPRARSADPRRGRRRRTTRRGRRCRGDSTPRRRLAVLRWVSWMSPGVGGRRQPSGQRWRAPRRSRPRPRRAGPARPARRACCRRRSSAASRPRRDRGSGRPARGRRRSRPCRDRPR